MDLLADAYSDDPLPPSLPPQPLTQIRKQDRQKVKMQRKQESQPRRERERERERTIVTHFSIANPRISIKLFLYTVIG